MSKKMSRVYTPRKITLKTALGYGITDFVGGGAMTIIGAWMMFFYTTYCNLSAVQGASIIGIARIVDAFTTLGMGSLTDNFYKTKLGQKYGRRHFFLYLGSPLLLSYITLWISGMGYLYYFVTYVAFEVLSSALMIPYETLPTEMTESYDERTKMSSVRMFVSAGATFLATFIPGQLFGILGQDSPIPFLVNGTIFAIIFAVCVFITSASTWERPITLEKAAEMEAEKQNKTSVFQLLLDYLSTFKLKSFRKHLMIYLLSFTGKDTFNTVFVYFCTICLGVSATVAANLLSLSLVGLIVTVVAGFMMIKFGPRALFTFAYSTMLIMLCCYYMIFKVRPDNMVILLFVVSLIYQVGRATLEFTPWNVFPFIPDLDEMVTGKHRAGIYAAVMTFGRKSTAALATIITGFLLDANGFVKGEIHQSIEIQNVIGNILVLGAGGLIVLALLVALTFKLNKQTHQVIVDEMNRLKNGGAKEDVTLETKKIIEDLTGFSYDKVWPEKAV